MGIARLRGPVQWTYFYLYVILDIFSRYAVGWMVARRENAARAAKLFGETLAQQGIEPGQVALHSDRGAPMRAKNLALALAGLGVVQSFGRPRVSDDNPFPEAHIETALPAGRQANTGWDTPPASGLSRTRMPTPCPSSTGTSTNTGTAHSAG